MIYVLLLCVTRKPSARSSCVFFAEDSTHEGSSFYFALPISHIPICAVQWINFEVLKDYRNCTIGRIRQTNWREWERHDKFNKESYISFKDLEPSPLCIVFYTHNQIKLHILLRLHLWLWILNNWVRWWRMGIITILETTSSLIIWEKKRPNQIKMITMKRNKH